MGGYIFINCSNYFDLCSQLQSEMVNFVIILNYFVQLCNKIFHLQERQAGENRKICFLYVRLSPEYEKYCYIYPFFLLLLLQRFLRDIYTCILNYIIRKRTAGVFPQKHTNIN